MIRHIALALCLMTTQATAAPESYRLDTARSTVGFTYDAAIGNNRGTMPITSANMRIDLGNLGASRVDVTLDATGTRAGFVFATEAMKGPDLLDAARHPTITFRSTAITGTLQEAQITGLLTVRGVTHPVTLTAGLYRQPGTDPKDLSHLTILLTGTLNRHTFGASGYANLVGPEIGLRIVAQVER
jgi:polyisoprenoid-binding protein YceI